MPLDKQLETYNSGNSLSANAGDWIDGRIDITQGQLRVLSNSSNLLTYTQPMGSGAGVHHFTFGNYDWTANGWKAGDNIATQCTVSWTRESEILIGSGAGTFITQATGNFVQTMSFTIVNIVGTNTISVSNLVVNPPDAGIFTLDNGTVFASTTLHDKLTASNPVFKEWYFYQYSDILVLGSLEYEQIDFDFNLTQAGSISLNSVIDGELSRFTAITGALVSGGSMPMTQIGNKSGSQFSNVTITHNGFLQGGAAISWRIDFKFLQWGIIEAGFAEPDYLAGLANYLEPIGKVRIFGDIGNPTSAQEVEIGVSGNTGGYDENYNGGLNDYSVASMDWFDVLGNPIAALDYSNECSFRAVVNHPNQNPSLGRFKLGLVFRPEDDTIFSNLTTSLGENLLLNAPFGDFLSNGNVDPTTHVGLPNSSGAKWDISNVKITPIGFQVRVEGTITPNSAAEIYFAAIPDGGRKTTLWLRLNNPSLPPSISNWVNLKLFDEDNIDAPTIGVQIPDVQTEVLLDHKGNNIVNYSSGSVINTTTEDDVLYKSSFLLPDNVVYESIRAEITVYNSATGEEFVLERTIFDFSSTPIQAGQMQINDVAARSFNLPPTTDRNEITIKREPSIDVAGKYGVELQYGFLNDWRNWLSQNNADNDFFNIAQSHDGKNKDWQHYSDVNNWKIRLSYYLELGGVEDFNHYLFGINPYDADPNVNHTDKITVVSTGQVVATPLTNELHEFQSTIVWTSNFADEWVEFTVEDFKSGNRWVISSVLDQGSVSANPWKPISGATKIDVTGSGTNTLVCKALLDSGLTSSSISISVRVYSSPNENAEIPNAKRHTDGTLKRHTDGTVKLKATGV